MKIFVVEKSNNRMFGCCLTKLKIKNLLDTINNSFGFSVCVKKIIVIICLICYVNCSGNDDNDDDVNERWYKIRKLYNEIEKLKFKYKLKKSCIKELREKTSSIRKRIKEERRALSYLKKNNKLDLARTKYKTIDRLVAQAEKIEGKLGKALMSSKIIALQIEALIRTKCTVTTYYYMNGVLIASKTRTIVVEFKELKKEMFVDIRAYDKGLRNPVVFRDNACTIILIKFLRRTFYHQNSKNA